MAVAFAGQGVALGVIIAIATAYLGWIWLVDLIAVARGFWAPGSYKARPLYWLFGLISFLSVPFYWLSKWGDPGWSFPVW